MYLIARLFHHVSSAEGSPCVDTKSRDSSVCHMSLRRSSSASAALTATARESQGQSPADSAPHRLARLSSSHSGALFVSPYLGPSLRPLHSPSSPHFPSRRSTRSLFVPATFAVPRRIDRVWPAAETNHLCVSFRHVYGRRVARYYGSILPARSLFFFIYIERCEHFT